MKRSTVWISLFFLLAASAASAADRKLVWSDEFDQAGLPDESKWTYEEFHVYAIEWTKEKMDFFVDDQKYFSFANETTGPDAWPYDQPQCLILNIAVGGVWGGQKGIDGAIFPQKMLVDYVRVYQ